MFELVTVGTWLFWSLVATFVFIEICFLSFDDNEDPAIVTALITFVAAVTLTNLFRGISPLWLVSMAAVYLALGVLWSIKKWYTFVVEKKAEILIRFNNLSPQKTTFADYAKDQRPTAARNKERIVVWMTLWPFSFSWWILLWPRRAFTWIYNRLSTLYDRISERLWNGS